MPSPTTCSQSKAERQKAEKRESKNSGSKSQDAEDGRSDFGRRKSGVEAAALQSLRPEVSASGLLRLATQGQAFWACLRRNVGTSRSSAAGPSWLTSWTLCWT